MAPNSEESLRLGKYQFIEESIAKEKQRPPIYNTEDYALSLKKWGRKAPNSVGIALYASPIITNPEGTRSHGTSFRDYRNPMLISSGAEMTLRQFGTVSELLNKLKSDLRLAYPSFIQEFVSEPCDGITLLLDLLRAIQLSQSCNPQSPPGSNHTTGKVPPAIQRRALLDELSCLQCLLSCISRYSEATRRLTASSAGLFTLAICIMSNVNKSRILALQLLTKVCEPSANGHSSVSEALSTLRLRFGEPVRFRFLVGMLNSTGGQGELLAAGMRFLNTFLDSASTSQKRLYIQAELEQAGFDIVNIKKNITLNTDVAEHLFGELRHWETHHIDVETLTIRATTAERDNDSLRDKILLLERKVQILQEEKEILLSLEQCLKDKCSGLQTEVQSLKSGKNSNRSYSITKKDDISRTEDEGISSSERSSSPEEELEQKQSNIDFYNAQNKTLTLNTNKSITNNTPGVEEEDEEETTIEEVIEELENIINDAQTDCYQEEEKKKKEQQRKKLEEAQVAGKIQMRINPPNMDDYSLDEETTIVPSNLHPQPPRKARSLVHLFVPNDDYEYGSKEMFFENDTLYTSDESSDSLLSASRFHLATLLKTQSPPPLVETRTAPDTPKPKIAQESRKPKRCNSKASIKRSESFRHLTKTHITKGSIDGSYYCSSQLMMCHQKEKDRTMEQLASHRIKSKSLDRIDDGLESMVDIVVTDHTIDRNGYQHRTKSDTGNMTSTSISRSISHVLISPRRDSRSRFSSHSEEKQRMFLPSHRDQFEVPYYFPRVQEKLSANSTFLIKRGHVNAGLYSGQAVKDNQLGKLSKSKEYIPSCTSNSRSSGKVTDLPSGLY